MSTPGAPSFALNVLIAADCPATTTVVPESRRPDVGRNGNGFIQYCPPLTRFSARTTLSYETKYTARASATGAAEMSPPVRHRQSIRPSPAMRQYRKLSVEPA